LPKQYNWYQLVRYSRYIKIKGIVMEGLNNPTEIEKVRQEIASFIEEFIGDWANKPEETHPLAGILKREDELQEDRRRAIHEESTEMVDFIRKLAQEARDGSNIQRAKGFLRMKINGKISSEDQKKKAQELLNKLEELEK